MTTQRRRVLRRVTAPAVALAVAATGLASHPNAAAATEAPREPIAKTGLHLAVETPDGKTLAFTGAGQDIDLRAYDSRAEAEEAGLAAFRVFADGNGFARIVTAQTGECLWLTGDGERAGATINPFGCTAPTGNFTVEDGRIVSPYGWQVSNDQTSIRNAPKGAFTIDPSAGADFGFDLEYAPAVASTAFEVTPPQTTDANDRARITGRATPNSTVTIHNALGASIVRSPIRTQGDGSWNAFIENPPKGQTDLAFLVTVRNADGIVERSRGTVSYGQSVSVASSSTVLTADGTATLRGTGEPGARLRVTGGATASPTTVADDGTWSVSVTPTETRAGTPVLVETTGLGGVQSTVPIELTAEELDADVVFPADAAEPAYVEGEARPGDVVVVVDTDGETIGEGAADEDGRFDVAVEAPDAAGEFEATVVIRDDGTDLAHQDTTIDYGEPVRITSPSEGDDLTPATVVRGTGEPGAEVRLESGQRSLTTIVGADGTWSGRFQDAGDRPFAITGPTELAFTDRSKPAITGTGTPGSTVRFQPNGDDAAGAVETTVQPEGTWRFAGADLDVDQVTDGRASVYDALVVHEPGTPTEQRATLRLTGVVQDLTVTSPEQGAVVDADRGFVTFTGTGTPGDQVATRVSGDGRLVGTVVRADGTWTIRDVLFAAGEHTATIIGVGGTVDVTFTVESATGSALTVVEPTAGSTVEADTDFEAPGVRFRGTGAPGAYGGVVDLESGLIHGFAIDALGGWALTVPLAAGESRVRVIDGVNAPVELVFTTVYP